VSNEPLWRSICSPEQFAQFNAINYCEESRPGKLSPIDDVLLYFRSVLPLGTKEDLETNDVLGRILLLGLVSGSELFFRMLLARIIKLCPLTRRFAADQMLSLGAVDFYAPEDLGLGLMENVSFATEGELLKTTRKLTGFEWNASKTSVGAAISQFEQLTQLRHSAVHAGGELGVRNLSAIGLTATSRQRLVIRFSALQEAGEICVNAVRAYNRFMHQSICERWIAGRKFSGEWSSDRVLFGRLCAVFCSRDDLLGGNRYKRKLYSSLVPSVLKARKPSAGA
jgi:hypothetical protein